MLKIEGFTSSLSGSPVSSDIHRVLTTQFNTVDSILRFPGGPTGLEISVLPIGSYTYKASIHINADAIGGFQLGMGGSVLSSNILYNLFTINLSSHTLATYGGRYTTLDSPNEVSGITSAYCEISGSIIVTADGTFGVKFAQSSAENGTSSVLAGSYLDIYKI